MNAPSNADRASCAHADCGCPPQPGHEPFCSGYCANAGTGESLPGDAQVEGVCACGHPSCHDEVARSGPGIVSSKGPP